MSGEIGEGLLVSELAPESPQEKERGSAFMGSENSSSLGNYSTPQNEVPVSQIVDLLKNNAPDLIYKWARTWKFQAKTVLALSMLLTACSPKVGSGQVEYTDSNNARVAEQLQSNTGDESGQMNYEGLDRAIIQDGESILSAIDRVGGSEGEIMKYNDLGVAVVRDGVPILHIVDKTALLGSDAFSQLVVVQPGDEIGWGSRGDVSNRVRKTRADAVMLVGEVLDPIGDYRPRKISAKGGGLQRAVEATSQENGG